MIITILLQYMTSLGIQGDLREINNTNRQVVSGNNNEGSSTPFPISLGIRGDLPEVDNTDH